MVNGTRVTGLYADRAAGRWVVRDDEANFWILPAASSRWEDRLPFHPTEDTELESVPGHYVQMFDLQFSHME